MVYEDLQCPDFPLPKHAWARRAAIAARYFQELRPGLAIAFRRHLLENIRNVSDTGFAERVSSFAQANGADAKRTLAALDNARYASLVEADFQETLARGVRKTPTVFVNGTPFVESFALEEITKAIDAALAAQP